MHWLGELTEHGHILPGIEIPVAPVGSVTVQCGIFLMVVGWLCTKCVNHPNVTPEREGKTL